MGNIETMKRLVEHWRDRARQATTAQEQERFSAMAEIVERSVRGELRERSDAGERPDG